MALFYLRSVQNIKERESMWCAKWGSKNNLLNPVDRNRKTKQTDN